MMTVSSDLKACNILLSVEDPRIIEEYVAAQGDNSMPQKRISDRTIFLKSYWMIPKIVDFGLAHKGDGKKPLRHPIQAPL